jgi:hypothetical protein
LKYLPNKSRPIDTKTTFIQDVESEQKIKLNIQVIFVIDVIQKLTSKSHKTNLIGIEIFIKPLIKLQYKCKVYIYKARPIKVVYATWTMYRIYIAQ